MLARCEDEDYDEDHDLEALTATVDIMGLLMGCTGEILNEWAICRFGLLLVISVKTVKRTSVES